jgi:hypothetical protein
MNWLFNFGTIKNISSLKIFLENKFVKIGFSKQFVFLHFHGKLYVTLPYFLLNKNTQNASHYPRAQLAAHATLTQILLAWFAK